VRGARSAPRTPNFAERFTQPEQSPTGIVMKAKRFLRPATGGAGYEDG
jgi:hypothetical protein